MDVKNARVLMPIIFTLIGLGVGFFGGIEYRNYQLKKQAVNFDGGNGNFQRFVGGRTAGANGGQNGAFRGGAVQGSILSMDDKSITVKLADGSSKIVLFSSATTYSNTASAKQSDLKVGSEVAVFGAANSDGSVTATSVQMNPMMFRPQGSPNPTP